MPGGQVPPSLTDRGTGIQLIENVDYRPWEPIAQGLSRIASTRSLPVWTTSSARDWAFEARYDRRRLDHAIEDASLADPTNFEIYTIVNPGQGVNKTIDGYANYLDSLGSAYGVPGLTFNQGQLRNLPDMPQQPSGRP